MGFAVVELVYVNLITSILIYSSMLRHVQHKIWVHVSVFSRHVRESRMTMVGVMFVLWHSNVYLE